MAADVDVEAREKLISALAAGSNHSEAARLSGYSRKHVKTLVKDPSFMALVQERRDQAGVDTSEAVRVGMATLLEIARGGENEAARVSAAKALVAMAAPRATSRAQEKAPESAAGGHEPSPEDLQRALRLLA